MFIDYFLQEIYIYFILILLGYIYYLNLYINKNNNKNFPPYFPNQWYFIDFSNNIKNKEIKRYSILDKEIIVFRTETNKIGILNAFCPHMGTHLIDGKVEKETIICPYHEWSFNINGECKNIPYTKSKITNRCNANKYYSYEKYNMIFFWYHIDDLPPSNNIGILNELDKYNYITTKNMNIYNMHIMEPSQNSCDYYHFQTAHKYLSNPFYEKLIKVNHKVSSHYNFDGYKEIIIDEKITELKLFGLIKLPQFICDLFKTCVIIEAPGLILFKIDNNILGNFRAIMTLTPIEKFKQQLYISSFGNKIWNSFCGKILTYLVYKTVEQDKFVWEKRSQPKPLVWTQGDGPFAKYSTWLTQFYTESSKKQYNNLDW